MLTFELLSVIDEYVEGRRTLEQLEDWLVPRLPLLFRVPPFEPEATDLAAAVELGLAELGRGDRSEEEFRNLLKTLITQVKVVSLVYPPEARTSSTESSNRPFPAPVLIYSHPELAGAITAYVL